VPIVFGFLACSRAQRFGWATGLGLLPLLFGEQAALITLCCGLSLLVFAKRRQAGLWLITAGLAVFFAEIKWVVPFCTVGEPLLAGWGALLAGGGQTADCAPTAPWLTVLACFGTLLFLPLLRPKFLVPALPALACILFACRDAADITGPATAGAAGALFFAFCEVLGPIRELSRQSGISARHFGTGLVGLLLLLHVLVAPSPLSRWFLTNGSFAFGMDAYAPTARDATILSAILHSVPEDDAVTVVSQNTLNWGALAERRHYASFPSGVFSPYPVRDLSHVTWKDFWKFCRTGKTDHLPVRLWLAQYVLLDLTRPWCVLDRQCPFDGQRCTNQTVARDFNMLVIEARQAMDTIYDQGGFIILRRRPLPAPTPAAPQAAPAPATPPQQPAAPPTEPPTP